MPESARSRRYESLEHSTFQCGTRAAYVRGCRCAACRAANAAYARERETRRRLELAELLGSTSSDRCPQEAGPVARTWTTRRGERRERHYRHRCPGVGGQPCASGSYLRKDSHGGICRECRIHVTKNDLVSTSRVRAHLAELSRLGIGRHAVAEASGVSRSLVNAIASGAAQQVRARTERALLAVDETCRADGALVPAARVWRHVRRILEAGWSRAAIARALGNVTPALQIGRRAVRLRTADRLQRLADRVAATRAERAQARAAVDRLVAGGACPRCGQSHEGDALAARWCLEHAESPLTEQERLNTDAGQSPAPAHVTQRPRKEIR